MKRGMFVLVILLLIVSMVSAAPPAPESQLIEDEDGNQVWVPIGDPRFNLDDVENTFINIGNELGEVETFTKIEECPVVFERESSGLKTFNPVYAEIDDEGKFVNPEQLGRIPVSPKNVKPEDAREQGVFCGSEEIREERPIRPKYSEREEENRYNYERLVGNAEEGIGVRKSEIGGPELLNPILEEEIVAGAPPPDLPESEEPNILIGNVVAEPEVKEIKVLVILVEFADQKHKASVEDIDQMFFGESDSLASYFREQSYGSVEISGEIVPRWYSLPKSMGYYGNNYELNVEDMISGAAQAADADIDYSEFDTDNDGIVDSFFVVHAGEPDENGGGNGPEIWSHYYSISPMVTDEGVKVIDYETVSESSPLGITIHEFGHYLGLPDMYDTVYDDGDSKGVGDWSIMGYGGYLAMPGSFDPWSKSYLGWLYDDNYVEVSEGGYYDVSVDSALYGIRYYLMPLAEDEYFMLENRREHELMKGDDAGGVLIWHIDENVKNEKGTFNGCTGTRWDCNAVNGNADHKLIDVEEADGKEELSAGGYGDDQDSWYYFCGTFGACNPTLFYSASSPSSSSYSSEEYDVAVSVNSEVSDSMEVGISLEGEVLNAAAESTSESVVDEVEEVVDEDGSLLWLWIGLALLVLVVLVLGFVVYRSIGNRGQLAISPDVFRKFK